ncbi:unnamed protein product [Blepharisma stoltei]|uniref:KATNIP domain-containing protein n=1 Tax=Blepharisma stoltei TaxID=1481888 RepID=A0AAU9IQT9_9CILI|nr:unnamed protein product [Blepharisma stoltei]
MDPEQFNVKKNPKAYIEHLENQNRIRKQLELRDRDHLAKKQKEQGFNIYLGGANNERVTDQRKREKVEKLREKSQERPANSRKKWGNPSFPIPSVPSLSKETHPDAYEQNSDPEYSDSFEEDEDEIEEIKPLPIKIPPKADLKQSIIQKISQLDEAKLEKLSRFLDSLQEEPQFEEEENPFEALKPSEKQQSFTSPKPKPVIHKHKRPYSSKGNEEKKEFTEIELRVLTTWGHAHLIGLTEIEAFNENSENIRLNPSNIQIKNTGHGVLSNPSKLVDGEKYTEDEKHMWLGPMPEPPNNLEIVLTLPSSENISALRLWNYNKSLLDSVKGVRELEVWKDGKLVWEGTVTRGCGNRYDDYYTDIPLIPNFSIKNEEEIPEDVKQENFEEKPTSAPMWLPGKPMIKEEKKEDDKLRPVASVPRVRHNQPFEIVQEENKKIETSDYHLSPAVLNFKKSSVTTREKKQIQNDFTDPALIPEPTLKLLGLNTKKKHVAAEPLKESLDSLEYFKITNESRIKRDTQVKSKPLEEILEVKIEKPREKPHDPLDDALDRFIVEQAAPKPQNYEEQKIPSYPKGQMLKFKILSTWGDTHYVGLCGIELFDQLGNPIKFKDPAKQISAEPADVNVLPGYGTDPRTVDKLLDGTNWTCDDLHVWLAPFTQGQFNLIYINLLSPVALSMIRIWNYNKSRIHSYRGVKNLEISFDNKNIIFSGEISIAPGRMKDADQYCEYIMFTKDDGILKRIEKNDWVKDFDHNEVDQELMSTIRLQMRPGTASREQGKIELQPRRIGEDGRPLTSAIVAPPPPVSSKTSVVGRKIRILILETWGDSFYVGLTGLQIFGRDGPIEIQRNWIDATPRDMNVIPGYSGDYRTLDKLINSRNRTTDDHNMWLIPYSQGKYHFIDIDLQDMTHISGINFWNYNKNPEDTARGVKRILLYIDGKCITSDAGIALRKAPGHAEYDFGQLISLPYSDGWNDDLITPLSRPIFASQLVLQDYETPYLPCGFILKLRLFSTWGDMHYIGMNGIELYDQKGRPILFNQTIGCSISANPSSIRELPDNSNDVRTPDKLIDGINNTADDKHMWLAPFRNASSYYSALEGPSKPNEITITFDKQICIGYIRLWNYSKTPTRGAKDFEILLDDILLYKGVMRQAGGARDWSCVVLFTGDQGVIGRSTELIYRDQTEGKGSVLLYNEGRLVGGVEETKVVAARPQTSVAF